MAVPFAMISSHNKNQVIINNLLFPCLPLVILLSTVNFQVETHSEDRNVLFCFVFLPLIFLSRDSLYICLLKDQVVLISYQ